jgi:hypothetical protein
MKSHKLTIVLCGKLDLCRENAFCEDDIGVFVIGKELVSEYRTKLCDDPRAKKMLLHNRGNKNLSSSYDADGHSQPLN